MRSDPKRAALLSLLWALAVFPLVLGGMIVVAYAGLWPVLLFFALAWLAARLLDGFYRRFPVRAQEAPKGYVHIEVVGSEADIREALEALLEGLEEDS